MPARRRNAVVALAIFAGVGLPPAVDRLRASCRALDTRSAGGE